MKSTLPVTESKPSYISRNNYRQNICNCMVKKFWGVLIYLIAIFTVAIYAIEYYFNGEISQHLLCYSIVCMVFLLGVMMKCRRFISKLEASNCDNCYSLST